MSDSDRSLEIRITTKADLTGAKAVEEQLDQNADKALAFGAAFDELGGKVTGSSDYADAGGGKELATSDAGTKPTGTANDASLAVPVVGGNEVFDRSDGAGGSHAKASAIGTDGEDALGRLQAGIEGLRLAVAGLSAFFGAARKSNPIGDEGQDAVASEDRSPFSDRGPERQFADASAARTEKRETEYGSGREGSDAFDSFADGQAQAIQSSGDAMRAALEENTRVTVSLFNRTLDLMEEQNRRLGDVDRRITELSGQIKSLKNL